MWNRIMGRAPGLAACLAVATLATAKAEGNSDAGVAAIVNGKKISLDEVDAKALGTNMKLAQQVYDARRQALDDLIIEELLTPEAAKQGKTVEALVAERLAALNTPVTDEEVAQFYEQNKSRMRGRTLEQISGQVKQYLQSQRSTEARKKLLQQVKKDASVKVTLDVPRVEVTVDPDEPSKGPATAKVTIVEYSEFQ